MPELRDIISAYNRIKSIVHRTQVTKSRTLDEMLGCSVFFKCENFQKGGSFKLRGAYNAISRLTEEERCRGIVASSSGNHAQAVAIAARLLGVDATVVMPENSVRVKVDATRSYGAKVIFCGSTQKDRDSTVNKLISKYGYTLIHPFDNDDVIAGAGTVAYELIEDVGKLDYIICPVGGGGLISGVSIAAREMNRRIKVIGVEPVNARDAYESFRSGILQPPMASYTIADGLRVGICERTFMFIMKNVDDIITVSERQIIDAMRFLWERMKLVVEPSGAVSLAGLMSGKIATTGKKIGVIISGGNVDLEEFFRTLYSKIRE